MYDEKINYIHYIFVTGPCEFLVMYDASTIRHNRARVTGPCEFLVMYDLKITYCCVRWVTGPCEFLVMYDVIHLDFLL